MACKGYSILLPSTITQIHNYAHITHTHTPLTSNILDMDPSNRLVLCADGHIVPILTPITVCIARSSTDCCREKRAHMVIRAK